MNSRNLSTFWLSHDIVPHTKLLIHSNMKRWIQETCRHSRLFTKAGDQILLRILLRSKVWPGQMNSLHGSENSIWYDEDSLQQRGKLAHCSRISRDSICFIHVVCLVVHFVMACNLGDNSPCCSMSGHDGEKSGCMCSQSLEWIGFLLSGCVSHYESFPPLDGIPSLE